MPKVSVIVPAYNATKYLKQCLDSLVAQTLTDIEVIMVNDGSTDANLPGGGTLAMMEEYAARDPRFRVIDKPNTGYGANINRGFAEATGEYLGILEADDFAEPDFLETLYTMAKEHDLDIARGRFWFYWSTLVERNDPKDVDPVTPGVLLDTGSLTAAPESPERKPYLAMPAIWIALYKASFIRENGITCLETPGASYQDTSFNLKAWMCAHRVMFIHKPLVHYRQDNEASSINNPGKVYLICGEFDETWRWLREEHPELVESIAPVMAKKQWDSYKWNFERIGVQFKREFADRMREEVQEMADAGLLRCRLFTVDDHRQIQVLLRDPDLYVEWRTPVPEGAGLGARLRHKFVTWRALTQTR
ncbi:MAG: glycosyltransferase [Eggerthellaceae bacterium]|nr:glycosyltransferase [Eggerthellaceae bacterium]